MGRVPTRHTAVKIRAIIDLHGPLFLVALENSEPYIQSGFARLRSTFRDPFFTLILLRFSP